MIAKTRFPQVDVQTFDNRIISHFRADGTLASMQKRWLKPDLTPYETVKVEFPESGNPLRVGVAATREPLTFVDADRNIAGVTVPGWGPSRSTPQPQIRKKRSASRRPWKAPAYPGTRWKRQTSPMILDLG